jgi:hypothetical protein
MKFLVITELPDVSITVSTYAIIVVIFSVHCNHLQYHQGYY